MTKELGPTQALKKYDQEFREWVAAKDIKKWGELNFPIYDHCLASSSNKSTPLFIQRCRRKEEPNQRHHSVINGTLKTHVTAYLAGLNTSACTLCVCVWGGIQS